MKRRDFFFIFIPQFKKIKWIPLRNNWICYCYVNEEIKGYIIGGQGPFERSYYAYILKKNLKRLFDSFSKAKHWVEIQL